MKIVNFVVAMLFFGIVGVLSFFVGMRWVAAFSHRASIVQNLDIPDEPGKPREARPPISERADKEEERGPIRIRLRWAVPEDEKWPDAVAMELVNLGNQSVRLWYSMFNLRGHVTMLLRDSDNILVSDLTWACLSSTSFPPEKRQFKELLVGEVYEDRFCAGSVKRPGDLEDLPPGQYSFQVIFEYHDLDGFPEPNQDFFARSEQISFLIGPRREFVREK